MSAAAAGRVLSMVRTTMGVTQAAAGERAGLSRYTIGRLERGGARADDPRYGHVARMYGRWLGERHKA
jgi:DNA-binding XRE family transcriptional regulator